LRGAIQLNRRVAHAAPISKAAKTIKKPAPPEPEPDPLAKYQHVLDHEKTIRVICLPLAYHDAQTRTKLALDA
jgi:hypothetical protein